METMKIIFCSIGVSFVAINIVIAISNMFSCICERFFGKKVHQEQKDFIEKVYEYGEELGGE